LKGKIKMGYLNNTGLQRFWNGIKGKFVRTVNGVGPDSNGNVQVPGGVTLGNRGVFYGTCDTAAATVEKAVVCPDFAANDLVAGSVVMVFFSVTNSGAVANLTLNVNSTGAKSIKYISNGSYANIPSAGYLKANQIYQFTFDGTYWVVEMNYDTNNNAYRIYMADAKLKPFTNLYRYMICFTKDEQTILPVNAVSNTVATGKQLTTEAFDPFGPIWYYNTTTTVNAGSNAGSLYYYANTIDLRYSFNTAKTLTASENVYIVCDPQSDGKVKLASNPISQSLPTTEDGKVYILLGTTYDTYRVSLHPIHPIYYYFSGALRQWTNASVIKTDSSSGTHGCSIVVYDSSNGYPKKSNVEFSVTAENADSMVLTKYGTWKPIGSQVINLTPTWIGNSASGGFAGFGWDYINDRLNAKIDIIFSVKKGNDQIIFHCQHYEPELEPVVYSRTMLFTSEHDDSGYYTLMKSTSGANTYKIQFVKSKIELLTKNSPLVYTELTKTRDGMDSMTLRIKMHGLSYLTGTPYIFVYVCCDRRRGSYRWRHPDDPENFVDIKENDGHFHPYGYYSLVGQHLAGDDAKPIYPAQPSWMPAHSATFEGRTYNLAGCLDTELALSDYQSVIYNDPEDSSVKVLPIKLNQWITPFIKPIGVSSGQQYVTWSETGIVGAQRTAAPMLFKFVLAEWNAGSGFSIVGTTNNILAIGFRKSYEPNLVYAQAPVNISSESLYISIR
jgi:hypothetical protein